ncbi:hypothetical protein DL93DRAFT_1206910 [Clavulina sp. PMI_390]|nr:hypothetical protein DL93DRAFT_1206910 [Clavulina sp. PMI_390]
MNSRPTRTTTTARLATAAPAPLSTIQRPQREKRPSNRKAMADDAEPTGPHRRGRKKQVSAKKNAESAEIGHCKGQPENKPKAKPPKVVHAVTASKASRTRPPKVAIDSALRNDNSNILNEGDDDDDNDDDGEIGSGVANPFGDGNDEDDDDNDEETNSTAAANASVSQERPQSNKNVGRNGSKAIKKPARSMNSPALTVQPKILILSTSARGPPTSASTASVPQPSIQATKKVCFLVAILTCQ